MTERQLIKEICKRARTKSSVDIAQVRKFWRILKELQTETSVLLLEDPKCKIQNTPLAILYYAQTNLKNMTAARKRLGLPRK
jgi:hypothetical protein